MGLDDFETVKLSDLKPVAYPIEMLEEMEKEVIEPVEIKDADIAGAKIGIFEDAEAMIRIDRENGEVWGKCTCQNYESPCVHIYSLYNILKEEEEEESVLKQDIETITGKALRNGKAVIAKVEPAVVTSKDTPELGKKKAMNMVKSAKTELQLIKKLDDLDEQIAIKDYVAGSAPLVYGIKTKNGVKYELSIRGWIQAMLYQGNIEIVDVKFEQIGDKTVAKAIVRDTARNIQTIGIAERVSNKEYFYTTLASKAIRNALKKIISPAFEQRVIKEAQEAKLVLTLTPQDIREVAEP